MQQKQTDGIIRCYAAIHLECGRFLTLFCFYSNMRPLDDTITAASTPQKDSVENPPTQPDNLSARRNVLDASWELLSLSAKSRDILASMNFSTIQEVFRVALAGKLAKRRKGSKSLEAEVLEAGCLLLGHPHHPFIDQHYNDKKKSTVHQVMKKMNGAPFHFSPAFLRTSVRDMLFPTSIHQAVLNLGIETVGDLLRLPIGTLLNTKAIGTKNLRTFLVCTFDYLFILNNPDKGLPPVNFLTPAPGSEFAPDIRTKMQLGSWFPVSILESGLKKLKTNTLTSVLYYGNRAGGVFQQNNKIHKAYLLFAANKETSPGFTIVDSSCSCQTQNSSNKRKTTACSHQAALAIHSLGLSLQKKSRPIPLPLLFQKSFWFLVGRILSDIFGETSSGRLTAGKKKDYYTLSFTEAPRSSWFSCLLTPQILNDALALFPGQIILMNEGKTFDQERATNVRELFKELSRLHPSFHEDAINSHKPAPSDHGQDGNFWFWLAQTFFSTLHHANVRIYQDTNLGLFYLEAGGNKKGPTLFKLAVPKARTPDLLDCLARLGRGKILGPAEAITSIYFDADGASLVITPSLKLGDGRIFKRKTLEPERYGRYYYLNGEGFLPVKEQKKEHIMGASVTKNTVIAPNQVPAFLRQNQIALQAEENDVDPALSGFSLIHIPNKVELLSCKIDKDWCYLSGHYGIGNKNISLQKLLSARQEGLKFLPSKGEWLKLTGGSLEWLYNLDKDRIWQDPAKKKEGIRLTRQELLKLSAIIPSLKINIRAQKERADLEKLLDIESWQDHQNLPVKSDHLRAYQLNGLAWLYQLYRYRLGGILADDMGLGKTHQTLSFFQAALAGSPEKKRFLVVCPASVASHWLEKANKFYPDLDVFIHHGSNRRLKKALDHTVIITTYGIVRRDANELSATLFDAIVLDEVQQAKNKKTDIYQAVKKLQGQMTIGLTGTPLENTVLDLKAIFDLCQPGFLGNDIQFKKNFVNPIEDRGDRKKEESLVKLIHPFLLRRTREQVLPELPDVIEDFRTCELSDDQVRLYREIIGGRGRMILQKLANESKEGGTTYMELLAIINYLKQVCDHPCLLEGCQEFSRYRSGKWELFVELLNECLANSMKVVVFSHYTKMLDIIEAYLKDADIEFCGLRGDFTLQKRKKMIHRFNTDPDCRVFSASLLAGGVGVDLTAAQAVIHYDRWWNAAREDQATARVHRLGQKHVVQVFKLITSGTLEEKIHQLIEKKREMAHNLIREDDASIIKELSKKELLDLLMWGNNKEVRF